MKRARYKCSSFALNDVQNTRNNWRVIGADQVPIWRRQRRDAAVAQQILAMYQKLTTEEQSKVLAAASYVVWVCLGKFSDIRFFYKHRLMDFVENIVVVNYFRTLT